MKKVKKKQANENGHERKREKKTCRRKRTEKAY